MYSGGKIFYLERLNYLKLKKNKVPVVMTCIFNLKVNPKVCFKGLLRVVIARQISKERKEVHVNHTDFSKLEKGKNVQTCSAKVCVWNNGTVHMV